ncbi:CoA-binding protein [Flavobacterium sp. UBA6031]|uniref:CoA-binding protein n=1 Tax=Flavobacterium sp. UBA6031 TaxID=1946551 RepID=UPI0025C22782|nr:CoA-binding protein [Flavobacterium sp. UBA6031]
MEKITRQDIDNFLDCKTIAVAGASRNEKSFSASVSAHLRSKNYKVFSINPNFIENNSERNEFKTTADLPSDINNLLVLTSPLQTTSVIQQAVEKGIQNIWIQQKSETPEALDLCRINNIQLVYKHCIFMFTQPEGIHRFHYGMKKIFGLIPH